MIVLPDTPPVAIKFKNSKVSPQLLSVRAAIELQQQVTDSTSYLIHLEEYLKCLLAYIDQNGTGNSSVLCEGIPWTNVISPKQRKIPKLGSSTDNKITWIAQNELYMTLIAITLTYLKKAAEMTNAIIDEETDNVGQFNENWKHIMSYYKTGISYILYAMNLPPVQQQEPPQLQINNVLLSIIHKISQVSIQIVILIKFSWINRNSFQFKGETIQTENNSTLSKVAIYILQELKVIKNLINGMEKSEQDFTLDCSHWIKYLNVIEKYINGYAGLFQSLQMYKEDKLGHALGLVHFSLLSLQSKQAVITESTKSTKNIIRNVRMKFNNKKNEVILSNLNSVSSLQIDKSAFNEKSSLSSRLILNDLNYLFDQLIKLNLKFTKENNNLKFDTIVKWLDIFVDSKWPTGCPIPISEIKPYDPHPNQEVTEVKLDYTGRGAYY